MKDIKDFVNSLLGSEFLSAEIEDLKQEITIHFIEETSSIKKLGLSEKEAFTIAKDRFADQNIISDYQNFISNQHQYHKPLTNLLVIGCSTGGPRALQQILPQLSKNLNLCILVVQHMPHGDYTQSLADSLNKITPLEVVESKTGMILEDGKVIIAKGGYQMRVKKMNCQYTIENIRLENSLLTHHPSIDQTLYTLKEVDVPIYVSILTGMGKDGTEGLKLLKSTKKPKVIAESEKTSILYGMPKQIKKENLVDYILDLEEIIPFIEKCVKEQVENTLSRENRILIASRSLQYRAIIRKAILEYNDDIEVLTVPNESKLISRANQTSLDLIITDLDLTAVKGFSNILFLPIYQYQLKSLHSILNLYYHHTA